MWLEVSPTAVLTVQGTEGVLLDTSSERFARLNETALEIWKQAAKGASAKEIAATLADIYDVSSESTETDVLTTFRTVVDLGLASWRTR